MPQVTITDQDDQALEAACPKWLGGPRNARKRVEWAIERALLADADKKAADVVARELTVLDSRRQGDTP